jgi:hypothetical protein
MTRRLATAILLLGLRGLALAEDTDHITALVQKDAVPPVVWKEGDPPITTGASFKPPVEITIVAKTNSTNLRLRYAAKQVIFNWEVRGDELRVDGGPAAGRHKRGAGAIPVDQFVTIKWIVTGPKQTIYVDDQLRYEHVGDYTQLDSPISVFGMKSEVTVKSIKVRKL